MRPMSFEIEHRKLELFHSKDSLVSFFKHSLGLTGRDYQQCSTVLAGPAHRRSLSKRQEFDSALLGSAFGKFNTNAPSASGPRCG